jgi:hypothetical protein
MTFALRAAGAAAGLTVLAAAAGGAQTQAPAPAQAQGDARPPCRHVLVAMEDNVDSAKSKAGDVFQFRLVDATTAPDGTALPVGTLGYGVVANAAHAERGGRGGYLALETRFFLAPDGHHVPAIIDRFNDNASSALGATANAPGLLGMIPIVGYAVGGYDAMHHGKDATIPRGTRVGVFVGDDAALGTCRAPAAGETPPPPPPPSPVPAASPAASAPPAPAPAASPSPR